LVPAFEIRINPLWPTGYSLHPDGLKQNFGSDMNTNLGPSPRPSSYGGATDQMVNPGSILAVTYTGDEANGNSE